MMTTLKVPDMHCQNCVKRITAALDAAQLRFDVSLENRTVTVEGGAPEVQKAKEALDDLGFDASED